MHYNPDGSEKPWSAERCEAYGHEYAVAVQRLERMPEPPVSIEEYERIMRYAFAGGACLRAEIEVSDLYTDPRLSGSVESLSLK